MFKNKTQGCITMSITPISTQNQSVNFFQTIPQDIFFNIFSRIFGLNEIRSLLFTDKGLSNFISHTDALWSNFIVTHFQFPLHNIPISLPSKDFYKFLKLVNQNIKANNYLFSPFQEQDPGVCCLSLYKDKCISGSFNRAIKVWDAKTKKELHTLVGHQDHSSTNCLTMNREYAHCRSS